MGMTPDLIRDSVREVCFVVDILRKFLLSCVAFEC